MLFSPDPVRYHETMRIACPSCNVAYQVPAERVTVGRVVRCARCGAQWAPLATAPDEAAELPPEEVESREVAPLPPLPEPAVDPVPPAPPPMALSDEPVAMPMPMPAPAPLPAVAVAPPRRRAALVAAWVVSLLVVAGVLAGLVVRHDEVIRLWPPSARAFVALGLASRP